MTHENRFTKLPDVAGTCGPCGKRAYTSRRAAKAQRQRMPSSGHMGVYVCPHVRAGEEITYHLGHLPERVNRGEVTKARYLRNHGVGLIEIRSSSMALDVRYSDPLDAARICDALLVAAEVAVKAGRHTLAQKYIRIANQTADAADLSSAPPVNPTPVTVFEEML